MYFLSPPVQLAWWAHMHHFASAHPSICLWQKFRLEFIPRKVHITVAQINLSTSKKLYPGNPDLEDQSRSLTGDCNVSRELHHTCTVFILRPTRQQGDYEYF